MTQQTPSSCRSLRAGPTGVTTRTHWKVHGCNWDSSSISFPLHRDERISRSPLLFRSKNFPRAEVRIAAWSNTDFELQELKMARCDVAIIGAGPYGLSATAHLRTVKGLDIHTFGEPMSFWQRNMPVGMLLRSGWTASQIADPNESLTLDAFRAANGNHFSSPVPLDCFVGYGLWYQCQAVPEIDKRKITRVESGSGGFRLLFEEGEAVFARRLVVAAGIGSFTWRPPEFARLPCSFASHTSEHRGFGRFAGKQVLVIGSGQSALESAALLHESGAEVEIVARTRQIRWL